MFEEKYKEACNDMKLNESFKAGLLTIMKKSSTKAVPRRRLVLAVVMGVILVSTSVVFATNYATNGQLLKSVMSGLGYDPQQTKNDAQLDADETEATEATPTPEATVTPTTVPTKESIAAETSEAETTPTAAPTPKETVKETVKESAKETVKETVKETAAPSGRIAPSVGASAGANSVTITWNKITSPDLVGYKVVASVSDSTPVYSENGYYAWITNADTTSCTIENGAGYNGGDVGNFTGGTAYYFSVTAVYGEEWQKIAGNAVQVTMPGTPVETTAKEPETGTYPAVSVSASQGAGGVNVSWTPTTDATGFSYYKVVASVGNSSPSYPNDGYVTYITDPNVTSYFVAVGSGYNGGDVGTFTSGVNYYFSITACYDGGNAMGNAVPVVMP